jgi:hypothetical protein
MGWLWLARALDQTENVARGDFRLVVRVVACRDRAECVRGLTHDEDVWVGPRLGILRLYILVLRVVFEVVCRGVRRGLVEECDLR